MKRYTTKYKNTGNTLQINNSRVEDYILPNNIVFYCCFYFITFYYFKKYVSTRWRQTGSADITVYKTDEEEDLAGFRQLKRREEVIAVKSLI